MDIVAVLSQNKGTGSLISILSSFKTLRSQRASHVAAHMARYSASAEDLDTLSNWAI
ncbi:hypothetical protein HanRHA438_Chr12g0533981 [Helianthus annuus]|nr:hypothetical protein HanRHA438_Chr12g0533981 [Helianthus annuus]